MRKILVMMLAMLLAFPALAEHDREAVRAAYREICEWSDASPYAEKPSPEPPYEAGELTEAAISDATRYANFLRWLAGVGPVDHSVIYNYQCQRAAVLLAALDYVDHNAPKPDDMDQNFYDSAHLGTSSGNIARFNWMRASIIREGVAYFARDDGDQNLSTLGHRRWLLNPLMANTGFGLCNARSGMSYVVMYAHDLGNPDARWDHVAWPAAEAFPAELMHDHLAWSVVLNPELYDLAASDAEVTLAEPLLGLSFRFHVNRGEGDGFCAVNTEPYGAGDCLIFRPDFEDTGFTDYQQNQHWTVTIRRLKTRAGEDATLAYAVDMIALTAQDPVNVELSQRSVTLRPGDGTRLAASVIPAYADDLAVRWWSTDEAVARVDDEGRVTAVAPGQCDIIVIDARNHQDACKVTVE